MNDLQQLRMSGSAEQARAIARGEIDTAALVSTEAAAIEERNPQLNAFVQFTSPEQNDHSGSDSPLFGTTFAVKDNIDVENLRTHGGLAALQALPAERDATVVSRLKQAGLTLTGKTNMSVMALGASTHNVDFGHCYNPLRNGYSAGGSSGGSASAVAAGLVGIALGTDTMGSVRIPAAMCGIVGFKPSLNKLPVDGLIPLCESLDHIGILSRTVEDASLAFSLLSQRQIGLANKERSTTRIRKIGVLALTPELQLQTDVEVPFIRACHQLDAEGYDLSAFELSGIDLSLVCRSGLLLSEAELLTTLDGVYPERKERMPESIVKLLDYIERQSAKKIGQATSHLAASRRLFESLFAGFDALILPTSAHTAFPMEGEVPANIADLTVIANVLGAPAISLPLAASADALPAGLQLVGRYGQDAELLVFAEEVASRLAAL